MSQTRRVNVVIAEEQHEAIAKRGLNLSGLIRDLLGDYLSESRVTIQVSADTRHLYDLIVSNTGATDEDLEGPLREALARVLEEKINRMRKLHEQLVPRTRGKSER